MSDEQCSMCLGTGRFIDGLSEGMSCSDCGGTGIERPRRMTSPDTGRAGEVRVTLPFPPSINRLYRAVGGRTIMSEPYRQWREEAGWGVAEQRAGKVRGPVSVSVSLVAPDKRLRDLDNVGFKAVIDLLVSHQIIEADDSTCVRKIEAEWASSGAPCTVTIRGIDGQ